MLVFGFFCPSICCQVLPSVNPEIPEMTSRKAGSKLRWNEAYQEMRYRLYVSRRRFDRGSKKKHNLYIYIYIWGGVQDSSWGHPRELLCSSQRVDALCCMCDGSLVPLVEKANHEPLEAMEL